MESLQKSELDRAKRLHPGNEALLPALLEEICELVATIESRDYSHARLDALHLAIIALRIHKEGCAEWNAEMCHECKLAEAQVDKLANENDRLRLEIESLNNRIIKLYNKKREIEGFANHHRGCPTYWCAPESHCTCGLAKALEHV